MGFGQLSYPKYPRLKGNFRSAVSLGRRLVDSRRTQEEEVLGGTAGSVAGPTFQGCWWPLAQSHSTHQLSAGVLRLGRRGCVMSMGYTAFPHREK